MEEAKEKLIVKLIEKYPHARHAYVKSLVAAAAVCHWENRL